jgi:general secretion pathway protein A
MYERFYNLRERPFALSPDPEYLYLSRVHREAFDSLRYGIESRAGFIVVTGEIGAGKTTLLQSLLRRLDERTIVARIVNTTLEPRELLEAGMLDFGLDAAGKSKPALLRDLGEFLVDQRAQGRRPLLVVDEAQNLSAPALEEVRLLSNLETEKSKLLQIVLVGQPNLRDTIASPELEQFRQRIAVSYHLRPLDRADTAAYINYRLKHAAIGEPLVFPPDVAALIHSISGGIPRIINVICDATLVFGYAEERHQIDLRLLQEVLGELEMTGILPASGAQPAPDLISDASVHAAPAAAAPPRAAEQPSVLTAGVQEQALARAAYESAERARLLDQREQTLVQRERELAEQRRVLAEEYRLLRNQRAHAAAVASAANVRLNARRETAPPSRYAAARPDGLRGWLKRVLSGASHRPAEGS